MRKRVLAVLLILLSIVFGSGITYSAFSSEATVKTTDQKIAKFVFNTEQVDHINFDIVNLVPGDNVDYNFSVTNTLSENMSNITLNYQMTINTFHLIPLTIELYKVESEVETLIMTCDESYTRNSDNELVCNSPIQEMDYNFVVTDDYKLKVSFDSQYSDEKYSDLVDYIDIEIKSWQKTGE